MRILYVADDLYPGFGGQARATEGHMAALAQRGHEVTAIAGREAHGTEPPSGVRVVRMPSLRLGGAQTRMAYPVLGTLAAEIARADVLHANTPAVLTAAAVLLAGRRHVPVVLGVHTQIETSTLQLPSLARPLTRGLLAWYGWLFGRADLLVAPTAFAAATSRGFTDVRVEVVSNGVDYAAYSAFERAPGPERRLLYVGRLSAEKRPTDLLELARLLPADHQLIVAGTGPLAAELAHGVERAGLADRVRLAGYVGQEEKRRLLADADVFVMPSPAELQSLGTLEAMAAGCAVVAFDYASSAVPQLVEEAAGGVVVPPADPAAQAAAVTALLDDGGRLRQLQLNAREYARTQDVSNSARRLEELYLEVLRARRGWS